MSPLSIHMPLPPPLRLAAAVLVLLFLAPLIALLTTASPTQIWAGIQEQKLHSALQLTMVSSLASLGIIVLLGTPLAWWLASTKSRTAAALKMLVHLPIVLPPAVLGVGLLAAFGRAGTFGSLFEWIGFELAFTTTAVIFAQILVAAPFYIQSAIASFRSIDPDMLLVARTLGAGDTTIYLRIVLPSAMPGLIVGAGMSLARAMGEFGATLLFAGNLEGVTQTLPLAIFTAFETDIQLAVVYAIVLSSIGLLVLGLMSQLPQIFTGRTRRSR